MFRSLLLLIVCFHLTLGALEDPRLYRFLDSYFPGASIEPVLLTGGFSQSKNYRFSTGGHTYVLRLLSETTSLNNRRRECFALKQAGEAGVAPRVYWSSDRADLILMDWVEGEWLNLESAKTNIPALAQAIQKIHLLSKNPTSRSSTEAQRTLDLIAFFEEGRSVPEETLQEAKRLISELMRQNYPKMNIHGDLTCRNIVLTQKGPAFIDWSETNWDDPYFDLTCLTLMHDFTEEEEVHFLNCYLGRTAEREENAHFSLVKRVNLMSFALNLLLVASETNPEVDDGPLLDWTFYVSKYGNEETDLSAQYVHDWGRAALVYFNQ